MMRVGALQLSVFRPGFFSGKLCLFLVLFLSGLASLDLSAREIQVEGRSYVDLSTVAARFGMQAYWLRDHKTCRLRSDWTTIDFGKQAKLLYINRMPVYLGFPTVESQGRLYLAQADYQHVMQPILTPQAFRGRPGLKRIAIDAGHGGHDSGARNDAYGLKEKDLTLDVAARLKALLERAGLEVVLIRSSEDYIPLAERPQRANQFDADLFISLHFNAAASKTAEGFETYALTPQFQASSKYAHPSGKDAERYAGNQQDPWNTLLAYHIQRGLVQRLGGPDRGVKRARWAVLQDLQCPGVLVEMGFVSHPKTAEKLQSGAHRQTLAQSLFDGILAYRQRLVRLQ